MARWVLGWHRYVQGRWERVESLHIKQVYTGLYYCGRTYPRNSEDTFGAQRLGRKVHRGLSQNSKVTLEFQGHFWPVHIKHAYQPTVWAS
jgi:hypothetical protein